ncbi:hypothetical protein [Mastadenovirus eidoli]|uniref:Uncharacterized protein n=1 Tax=Eidolon helvum adenovirus TaxID=2039267 RepID=A0A348FKI2_9ADEN|nr:hypothetical protein QKD40_gp29 [Eidolon helvum adenovirus]BBF72849.1 hypothetical protein [Eidolon helvum adenovirus]
MCYISSSQILQFSFSQRGEYLLGGLLHLFGLPLHNFSFAVSW